MSGGGLWNDYDACELEYHETLLLACQQHRTAVYFNSKDDTQKVAPHILSMRQLAFLCLRPRPFGLKYEDCLLDSPDSRLPIQVLNRLGEQVFAATAPAEVLRDQARRI